MRLATASTTRIYPLDKEKNQTKNGYKGNSIKWPAYCTQNGRKSAIKISFRAIDKIKKR